MSSIVRFADPFVLLLLLGAPVLIYIYFAILLKRRAPLRYSNVESLTRADTGRSGRWRHLPFVLRLLAMIALLLALARPQAGVMEEALVTEGIDIMLALDLSRSMLAEDMTPNRIGVAKDVAAAFVRGRENDRIGLVAFAGTAFTQVPLTLDREVVAKVISELEVGMIENGTAVGMGLATAVKRLESSSAESKVVVLLTDGRNNQGQIRPVTAAQIAQTLGVRVYAIGAGSHSQTAPVPLDDPVNGRRRYANIRVDVDEETLRQIADITGGDYFRATDRESLELTYAEIDELETTQIEVQHFKRQRELFHIPLLAGLALFLVELGASNTVLRRLP